MTKQLIENADIAQFLAKSREDQQTFISSIKINELKGEANLPLLKKFIAMKLLMELRRAAEEHSSLNITAQFRNFLSSFSKNLKILVSPELFGEESDKLNAKEGNSYTIGHISDMGLVSWNRKYFKLRYDEDNQSIGIIKMNAFPVLGETKVQLVAESIWNDFYNKNTLEHLFAEIKQETSYTNTLGYDLLSVALYCSNSLFELSIYLSLNTRLLALPLVPIVIVFDIALLSLVLPPTMALMAIEKFLIEPVKFVVESLLPNEHKEFIDAVTAPALS